METVTVTFNGKDYEFNQYTRIRDMLADLGPFRYRPLAARVDNHFRELNHRIDRDVRLELLDLRDSDGQKVYQRSLSFVFVRAVREVMEDAKVYIEHSISKGLYCEIKTRETLDAERLAAVKARMEALVEAGEPFDLYVLPKAEAINLFETHGMDDKRELLSYSEEPTVSVYRFGWLMDYFYGYMVPDAGYLTLFDLKLQGRGVVIRLPDTKEPDRLPAFIEQKKLAAIFDETERWGDILNVSNVASLNRMISENRSHEIIQIAEALHEKKIGAIADMIHGRQARVVMIAGPSSSGKTTFAHRLFIQLRALGLSPLTLSTDDYFVDREKTPLKADGSYDFESLEALDIETFNRDLKKLLEGDPVKLPVFDFMKGARTYPKPPLELMSGQPVIVEGIHGLNDRLLPAVDPGKVFKIYISALTQLNIDNHNRIQTTDARLIRRIVRDNRSRGHDAVKTIGMWKNVREGEEENIFPFQEQADVMFNSALVYELAVLKKYALPLLKGIDDSRREYTEARRLIKFLSNFLVIEEERHILQNSILREFIGGSCYL